MSGTRLYGGGFETAFPKIAAILPPFEFIAQTTELTFYGLDFLIADLVGLPAPQPSLVLYWTHGWNDPAVANVPASLIDCGGPEDRHLIGCEEHAEVLIRAGFKDVHAVGLPFIYADQKGVERLPESLLVMPPHSLGNTQHDWPFEEYARYIVDLSKNFKSVAACVHSSCVDRGFWYPQFEKLGIPWVRGAAGNDRHALKRMQILMRSFEFMTTNSMGSHLAYGAYCGMKVSVFGPYLGPKEKDYDGTDYYKGRLESLKAICAGYGEASLRARYPWLFVHPREATLQTDWGNKAVGASCRRSPQEIAQLLGWKLDPLVKKKSLLRKSLGTLKNWIEKSSNQ